MEKTVRTPEEAVKEYQCSGCVGGPFPDCYKTELQYGVTCRGHVPGTGVSYIGRIFLGMPTGFNRLGRAEHTELQIFESIEEEIRFDKFNVPVWKHLDKYGNTLVRGYRPRINDPFVVVILGNHLDEIDCLEITEADMEKMDY